jgi:threonine aldolase
MAQQIALRIWCERRNNFTVAMHPTAHLEYAELLGYQFLHQIHRLQFGIPEFLKDRMLTVKDFEGLGKEPGVILLECPTALGRPAAQVEELLAIGSWPRRKDPVPYGWRPIWACQPFYQKEFRIADLFDSVYALSQGSRWLQRRDVGYNCVDQEARVWQRRLGGNLFTQGPSLVAAKLGYQKVVPQIHQWVQRAQEIAAVFSQFERISINPNPPQVNFFQLYLQGDAEALTARHMDLARETGTFIFYGLSPTIVPGIATTEIHCWENAMKFKIEELGPFVEKLLG